MLLLWNGHEEQNVQILILASVVVVQVIGHVTALNLLVIDQDQVIEVVLHEEVAQDRPEVEEDAAEPLHHDAAHVGAQDAVLDVVQGVALEEVEDLEVPPKEKGQDPPLSAEEPEVLLLVTADVQEAPLLADILDLLHPMTASVPGPHHLSDPLMKREEEDPILEAHPLPKMWTEMMPPMMKGGMALQTEKVLLDKMAP